MSDEPLDLVDRRTQSYWERLDAIQDECRRGHKAVRKSVSELEAQADALDHELKALTATVEDAKTAPVEATKLRFSPQVLAVIFTATFTLAGSVIGAASIVRSDMRNINTRMDADAALRVNDAKRADERYAEIKDALGRQERQRSEDKASAAQLLRKYDDESLRRDLLQGGKK